MVVSPMSTQHLLRLDGLASQQSNSGVVAIANCGEGATATNYRYKHGSS